MKLFTFIVISVFLLGVQTQAQNTNKPNVVFIISDDQSYETIRALGHTDIDTPNLDRLTTSGTTFTHAYNMGGWNGAICVASRTMLITGRTLWHAREMGKPLLDAEREAGRLWPQRMAKAGYETYMTGKWHVSTDAAKCFDFSASIRGGMPRDESIAYNRPLAGKPDPWSPSDTTLRGFWDGGKHWSEVVGTRASNFSIKRRNQKSHSSCIWLSTLRMTRVSRPRNTWIVIP